MREVCETGDDSIFPFRIEVSRALLRWIRYDMKHVCEYPAAVCIGPKFFLRTSMVLKAAGDIRISNQFVITRALLLHNERIIKQASLSHWVAEYNLKVSRAW